MAARRRSRRDPEDALIRRVQRKTGRSKSDTVRLLKGTGQIKQSGGGLEPTAKGRRAIRKIKSKRG